MFRVLSLALIVLLPTSPNLHGEDPVFSGPQVGEQLPSFPMLGFFAEQEGKPIDLLKEADGGPIMIVFFHELTRPGFGLMRAVTNFAGERTAQGLKVGVVFLTDDATETLSVSGVGTSSNGSVVQVAADGQSILYAPAANFSASVRANTP